MKKVSVSGKKDPIENVKDCLSNLDLSKLKDKSVLLKPNVGRAAKSGQGYNTNPETMDAIIEIFINIPVKSITIGESPLVGIDTFKAYEISGIAKIAKKHNVNLIAFDDEKPIKKDIPEPRVVKTTKICKQVFEYDFVVSVPVAKTHMHTGVTLGIKNMKGCLYKHEKVRYHQLEYFDKEYPEKTLDSAISDLATVLLPDLTIIDGYIGMEGLGPSGGTPKNSNFVIASWDALAADVVGCHLMGYEAKEVPHLRLVSERLGGSLMPNDYELLCENNIDTYIDPYLKPPKDFSMSFPNIVIHDKESCSSCLSTLMLFLKRFKDDMSPYLLSDGNFHIAIGKAVKDTMEGTVFVGNCTKKHCKGMDVFVAGCPPVPTRIYEAITGQEPEENEPEVK